MATMEWLMGTPLGPGAAQGAGYKAQCSFPQFLLETPDTLLEAIPYAMLLRSNVIFKKKFLRLLGSFSCWW